MRKQRHRDRPKHSSTGTLYFNGEEAHKDYQQALLWFRLAADQGEALAQTKIAIMYDEGEGVRRVLFRRISGTASRQRMEINQHPTS
jgi:TPR repeat protein